MPQPVRPVRDCAPGYTGNIFQDPFALTPLSDVQKIILEQESSFQQKEAQTKKGIVSQSSQDLLFKIWNEGKNDDIVLAQKALNQEDQMFKVPSNVSDYDVIKLVQEGVAVKRGHNLIAFTEKGKFTLGKAILGMPNKFDKGSNFRRISKKNGLTRVAQLQLSNVEQEYCDRILQNIEGGDMAPEGINIDPAQVAQQGASDFSQQTAEQLQPKIEGLDLEGVGNVMKQSKSHAKSLIVAALRDCDAAKHGVLIEKLSTMYDQVQRDEISPDYVLKLIKFKR